jgi:YfiH family protein
VSVGLLYPQWQAPARVRAACTLRTGGVSVAPFASLNLGAHVGDAPDAVAENRRRVRTALALPAEPLWLQQVHGARVADADANDDATAGPADAAIARQSGRVLAILVADCMPVLFASDDGAVIAAAHAGWRGLAGGVLEATVAAMNARPRDLHAWLGPAIGADHFEVGEEVRAALLAHDARAAAAFVRNDRGRWQCDLAALARQRLAALGVTRLSGAGLCTYADAAQCYSYRRDARTGRMAALIWRAGAAP